MRPLIEMATRLQAIGPLGPAFLLVIKATMILLIARLLLLAVPKASAATKHLALTIALCGVIALPVLSLAVPAWQLALLPAQQEKTEPRVAGIGSTGDDQEDVSALTTAVNVAKAAGVVPEERITRLSAAFNTVRNSWQGLIVLAVAGVSFLLLLRMAAGVAGVWTVKRSSEAITDNASLQELDYARDYLHLKREVHLLRSSRVSVPVVWGMFKPVLMLPAASADWTRERLRVVLLHELAHVKRLDGITLLITKAAVAIFWFHPLAWSLERFARAECERACDDLVLESGTKASDYAEHLLSIAKALPQADPFRSVTLAMTRRSQLEGRLLSILHPHIRRRGFSAKAISIVATATLLILAPLAAVRIVAAPVDKPVTKDLPEGVVEIGPSVASKVMNAPEMLMAQLDRARNKFDKKHRWNETPENAADWYDRGMELHHADRYPEAIAAFQQSISGGHRVAASTYNIACGYALMGDEANSVKYLESAVRAGFDVESALEDSDFDPIRSGRSFQQLLAAHGEKDDRLDSTVRRYESLRASNSDDTDEWFDVALDLLRLRRYDEAIDSYQRVIRQGDKTSTAMYNLACAYSLRGDVTPALDWLQKAVENGFDSEDKFDSDPDLNNIRRNPRFAQITALADDLRLTNHMDGKRWLGNVFAGKGWGDSIAEFEEATRKYPSIGRTWFNLGYAQLQAGDGRGSVSSFRKAAELGYRPATSLYNTACAYARSGQTDAAFQYLEKARAAGFKLNEYLDDDDDLESLHDDPRFDTLRREVRSEYKKEKVRKHKVEVDLKNVV